MNVDEATIREQLEVKAAALRDDLIYQIGTEASALTATALTAAGLSILTPKGPTGAEDTVWRRLRIAGADAALRAMVDEAVVVLQDLPEPLLRVAHRG